MNNRVMHFEIQADDVKRASSFYQDIFGWKIEQWEKNPYWLVTTGSEGPGIDGGLAQREMPCNSFLCTVQVDDLDAALARVQANGGEVARPRGPIPTVGWFAYVKDTEGNLFGLIQLDENAA